MCISQNHCKYNLFAADDVSDDVRRKEAAYIAGRVRDAVHRARELRRQVDVVHLVTWNE